MIQYIRGNLFTSNAKVLVNTVNTVGVMGKGIAAQFKKNYPLMYKEYKTLCEEKKFDIGQLYLYQTPNKWVLNFPTKRHWRNPSKLEYIEQGLIRLTEMADQWQITSIAMPKLGCGNGGLDWESQVKPLVEKYLKKSPIQASIYDFDQDLKPEHLDEKTIQKWLASDPETLTFAMFYEDLKQRYFKQDLFAQNQVYLAQKPYQVEFQSKDDAFELTNIETMSSFILTRDDIKPIFFTLKNLGKLCPQDLFSEHYSSSEVILDFFARLPYVVRNQDKIVLNYAEVAGDTEVLELHG